MNKHRSDFQNAMYAPPSSVVNAKKVIEYYAELSSVSAKEYALDSLLVSLLIDLDEFCGYEHDLDLEKLLSSARQRIDCERGDLQSPTNGVLCNQSLVEGGDNWGDLCPGCADHVSEYMDEQDLHGRIGRAKAISHMSRQ